MANSIVQNLLSIMVVVRSLATGSVDFCKSHLFDSVVENGEMHFSKENSEREIAAINGSKSLHCCSHGYSTIEWFKDGIPYPWSDDVSTFAVLPGTGNQSIHSESIAEVDSGGYWCVVRNGTEYLRHDVFLKVSRSLNLEGPPKPTYQPKDQTVMIGESTRFYCEAFLGNRSLFEDVGGISWRKADESNSNLNNERFSQEIVSRDGGQVLGCYLYISEVKTQDFGKYVCRINSTGNHVLELNAVLNEDKTIEVSYLSETTWLFIILMIISAALSLVSILFFRSHFKSIYIRLFEDSYSKGKECDILILYHADDTDIAMNKIVLPLQDSYHCSCKLQRVTFCTLGSKELTNKSKFSKRMIILLSRSLTENEWSCQKLNIVLNKVISLHPKIITVFLEPLPQKEPPKTFNELLQRVYRVQYDQSRIDEFWESLAVGLPNRDCLIQKKENEELV